MIRRLRKLFGIYGPNFIDSASKAGFEFVKTLAESSDTELLVGKGASVSGPIFLRMNTSDVPTFRKIFLENEYSFSLRFPPKVIIDAGANTGLSAVYFAVRFPSATVYALEPEPENFKLLVRNTRPYANIRPVQAALWHETTVLNIIDFGKHDNFQVVSDTMLANDHDIKSKIERYGGKVILKCDAICMADLISRFQLDGISLLKMDIEGSEREVFVHSSAWIGQVDAIIAELHEKWHPGCDEAFHANTDDFGRRWTVGESHFVSRSDLMTPTP